MKLSKKGEYCVRAMMDLAMQDDASQMVFVKDIARRQEISERFLEHVLSALKSCGLVKSARGAHGGFALALHPSKITLLDILRVSQGDLCWTRCAQDPSTCSRSPTCAVHDIWTEFGRVVEGMASAISLAEIVQRQRAKLATGQDFYEI